MTTYTVPVTAADTIAEGAFNWFYMRAICRRAIADGIPKVIVYRAKQVITPRRTSIHKIGDTFDPVTLLADLRNSPEGEAVLGEWNSGLTLKLP